MIQVRTTQRALLEEKSQDQGLSIARDVAARATDLILVHDFYSLYQLLEETKNNYHDIRYVFITDPQGEILAHTFGGGFPIDLVNVNNVGADEFQKTVVLETDEGLVWDVAVPIFGGKAGTARIGVSDASVRETMSSLTSQLLITLMGVLVISLVAATLLTWILTRPILDLVKATQAVAQGDFSSRVRRWADDEIGDLAVAFNHMTEELGRLDEVRQEREQLRRKLLEGVILAQEEERRRIARELHDSTSQSLTSLKVNLATLEGACECLISAPQYENMCEVLDQTLDEVHNLAVQLRPAALDDLGLDAALERYLTEWQQQNEIKVEFVIHTAGRRLPEVVETAVYRIIQESLTNVARHAEANYVSVLVERRNNDVITVIEDDGIGFAGAQSNSVSRLGLLGIRERTELLDGNMTIETAPQEGTSLFIRIPIGEQEEAAL
jgi:signal transduction histidine kinase